MRRSMRRFLFIFVACSFEIGLQAVINPGYASADTFDRDPLPGLGDSDFIFEKEREPLEERVCPEHHFVFGFPDRLKALRNEGIENLFAVLAQAADLLSADEAELGVQGREEHHRDDQHLPACGADESREGFRRGQHRGIREQHQRHDNQI